MDESQTQTLSIPSLVAFAIVSFFAIRYLFFSSSSPTSSNASAHSRRTTARRRNFPPDRVDNLASMFPQLSRRDIEWDLVNNGGSVQATSERVLTGGRLPTAPPNFTPVYAASPAAASSAAAAPARSQQKSTYQDLITRYNLSSKVTPAGPEPVVGAEDDTLQSKEKQREKGGWSSNKNERQELMKRRREEMILAARRKMQERERKGKENAL